MTQLPLPSEPPNASGGQRAVSPTASYDAMSDDEEGGYNTVVHTETGRRVKILHAKSKVYIHPTPSAKDNIPGYVALLLQNTLANRPRSSSSASSSDLKDINASDLLLAWCPEGSLGNDASAYNRVDLNEGESPPRQSNLVQPPPMVTSYGGSAGPYPFAIPVGAIYSITVRPPNMGWWYGSIIINTRAGDSLPPLFFHDNECQSTIMQKKKQMRDSFDPFGANGEMFWGGDMIVTWLRRYVEVLRSDAEPSIYLIEPNKEDTLSFGGKLTIDSANTGNGNAAAGPSHARTPSGTTPGMDPVMKFVRDTGWNVLEKFSKITTVTRRAAQDVLDNPNIPPQVRRLLKNPEVQTLQEEFDSARIYLARWATSMAEQSERERRQRIWTTREVMELEETDVGEFELLEATHKLSLAELHKTVTMEEWKTFFDADSGRLTATVDEVKERVFHGGLDADDGVRNEAWLFLLGVYDWHSTADERKALLASLRDQYYRLKSSWWEKLEGLGGESEEGEKWREERHRIEKDVHRTDREVEMFKGENLPHPDPKSPFAEHGTNVHLEQLKELLLTYHEYNPALGYTQGMSDLLAPIYAVVQDDVVAFWCFQHFMERMERNFLRDQSGMHEQLRALDHLVAFMDPQLYQHLEKAEATNFFFVFRPMIVWYKREFEWADILHLWEVLWTDYLSSNFHLFVTLAILEKNRNAIMDHLDRWEDILKFVNGLSGTMDLDLLLTRAETLFRRFQRMVEAVDRKSNFPAPRFEGGSTGGGSSTLTAAGSSSASQAAGQPSNAAADRAKDKSKEVVQGGITPELRGLLSRKIVVREAS